MEKIVGLVEQLLIYLQQNAKFTQEIDSDSAKIALSQGVAEYNKLKPFLKGKEAKMHDTIKTKVTPLFDTFINGVFNIFKCACTKQQPIDQCLSGYVTHSLVPEGLRLEYDCPECRLKKDIVLCSHIEVTNINKERIAIYNKLIETYCSSCQGCHNFKGKWDKILINHSPVYCKACFRKYFYDIANKQIYGVAKIKNLIATKDDIYAVKTTISNELGRIGEILYKNTIRADKQIICIECGALTPLKDYIENYKCGVCIKNGIGN